MVIAIPAALVVQRHHKHIGVLQALQQHLRKRVRRRAGVWRERRGACTVEHERITQRAAHAVQDGGLQQEGLDVRWLACEDFVGQILAHEAVAAAERADEAGPVVPLAHRQRGQLQAGDPALGARLQRRHVLT